MNRRELIAALAAAGALPATHALAQAAPGGLRAAAREAWLYSLPLIEMATTRARALATPGAAINRFQHARQLAGPASRAVTAPNNDTLYSTGWADMSAGPVTLVIPPTGDRYISVQIMDMYTNNNAVLGTRTLGGGGGRLRLLGPGQPGSGPDVVRIATPHAWVLARTLVSGPDDLPAVARVQNGLSLAGPATPAPPPAYAGRNAPWADYFAAAQALIVADPPPATDGAAFVRMAPLGLGPRGGFDAKRFTPAQAAEIEAGVADARAALRSLTPGAVVQGWTYPRPNLGVYGEDYLFRAGVALSGLAALPPAEATYLHPRGEQGRMFTGPAYRLTFPPGQRPPVDGFWSLTMYEATPDGQFFLVANPQNRYAIGDRTPGLKANADGSLDIWISRADPGGERSSNWLPAPAQGPFTLSLRAYRPRPELLDGRYRVPAIVPA